MEISSGSSTSCFDSPLEYLDWMRETLIDNAKSSIGSGLQSHILIRLHKEFRDLGIELRLLQSFDLYLTKCRRRKRNHETCLEQAEEKDVASFRIQNLIIRRMQDLEFACSEHWIHSRSLPWTHIISELSRFREAIKLFFETHNEESCINFLLEYYWLRDPELVIDFIDSVSKTLAEMKGFHLGRPGKKLMLLKSFIRFAMLRGVKGQQLQDLLIHAEVIAVNALHLASTWCFHTHHEVWNETKLQMSRLIREKINPGDPKVRETYIHVLTAAKLSRSSDISALEKNKHLVADFMYYLVPNIIELLESCTSTMAPIMNQMLKLLEGLRFLTILLRHQKKFKELRHEMKNLIGVVVCDAAIIIFSLYVNQIEEDLVKETNVSLLHLLKVLKFIRAEVIDPVASVSGFGFPRTNELGSIDFFLTNLKELARCDEINGSIAFPVDKIQTIQKDFEFLRSFLEKIREQCNQNKKLQVFWSHVMEIAYKAEFVIDSTLVGDRREYCLDDVARDINVLKIEAQEIYDSISYVGETTKGVTKTFTRMPSQVTVVTCNKDLLPLDDEVENITKSLTRGGSRRLDVVCIVGMPGLGKTTLANIVYNSPSVMPHFNIRAWCTVSQAYSMHNMLVQILGSIESGKLEQYQKMDEHDLAIKLKQVLLRNKYLLVLDDLWDAKAWNLLERSLPDDANRSRILITSRLQNLSLQFKPDSKVHHLRRLTNEESWNLLQKKLFGKEGCPPRLSQVASQIAKSCRGLPLTVVLVAGILDNTAEESWEEVAKSLPSSIVLDDEYCMKTLELSYSHLPDDLKPCLLYFGAFHEDKNVPIRKLLWLWISEGFVLKTEGKRLENAADDYLKDLVDRSLVMVSKQRTMGGAKACQLHDLVHEFCVKKAKEENFLHILHSQNGPFVLAGPSNPLRVCDRSARNLMIRESVLEFPNVRSLLLFEEDDLGFWLPKLLRVLDLGELVFDAYFPVEVLLLAHLRYLALSTREVNFIPAAIANLSRLQTFLLRGNISDCFLPKTIWNIKTLRHLWITNSTSGFIFPVENLEVSPDLDQLDTLSLAIDPSSQSLQKILTKLPGIRRLRCMTTSATRIGDGILPFDCFSQLESLRLHFFFRYGFKFPLNLKKLTLLYNKQPWSEISTIGKLPNLEVLKLLQESVAGEEWEMKEGEFPNLRVLKFRTLWKFRSWTASSDNFPRLEKLVVHNCPMLEEVPSCLGECQALEMIEVRGCRESVASSVQQIQQEQREMGNEVLEILIEKCVDTRSSSKEEEEESSPS